MKFFNHLADLDNSYSYLECTGEKNRKFYGKREYEIITTNKVNIDKKYQDKNI